LIKLLILSDAESVHTERWCRYFEDEGFETALYSLEPCRISPPRHFFGGKRPTSIGVIDYYLARRDYRRILERFRPDIVNAHFVASYGWLASHRRRCPVVVTAWGSDLLVLPERSIVHRKRVSRALKKADYLTVDNHNLLRAASRFIPEEKIIRIIMGVDKSVFERSTKTEFPGMGPVRIIAPRGLKKIYDPGTIIAAAKLLEDKIEFRVDLPGDEPEAGSFGEQLKRDSASDVIRICPFMLHEEFVSRLKEYDIYVSASLSDSTSVALLEAMAVGLFPVVSDIEGNREWIDDGENGLLFEPGSASSLAAAVEKAIGMRHKFEYIANINRNRVRSEAIWEDNMNKIKELFIKLAT